MNCCELVPSELTSTVFWTRYFFRAHQIEAEEEKRKLLIEGMSPINYRPPCLLIKHSQER